MYGFVKTSLELKERTLHSRLCDTTDQFITRAFRADFNTATEKKSKPIRIQKRTDRGSALKQNMARVTKKDKNEKHGTFYHFTAKVDLFKVSFHKWLEKVISKNCKLNL